MTECLPLATNCPAAGKLHMDIQRETEGGEGAHGHTGGNRRDTWTLYVPSGGMDRQGMCKYGPPNASLFLEGYENCSSKFHKPQRYDEGMHRSNRKKGRGKFPWKVGPARTRQEPPLLARSAGLSAPPSH